MNFYNPVSRLTEANYSDGRYLHYAYDSNGNRLSEEAFLDTSGIPVTTEYAYDISNRLISVGNTSYTWSDTGNLLSDGTHTYTYDSLNRLTNVSDGSTSIEYAYNGHGDMIQKVEGGQTTSYTLDLASGLSQILSDGTTDYLYGNTRLGQDSGGDMEFFLADALGSVRQLTNDTSVLLTKEYKPYGEVLSEDGRGESYYGFGGEWTSPYNELVYLRARWYTPIQGRLITKDPWAGSLEMPMSYNLWLYGYSNPIRYIDSSGKSAIDPNCSAWPSYNLGFGSLNELCNQADWTDNQDGIDKGSEVPESVLNAREAILRSIIRGSNAYYLLTGKTGYAYAAEMFSHFLDGNGSPLSFRFTQYAAFVNDPGIIRATRSLAVNTSSTGDDPDVIIPLMLVFMAGYVQPEAILSPSSYSVGPIHLKGVDSYFSEDRETGLEPRAYDSGYWAAFGHVIIDGDFSGVGKYSCSHKVFVTSVNTDYQISDTYRWFANKSTPLPLPGVAEGQEISAPHLWWISLINANPSRANEFDYDIKWHEHLTVSSDATGSFEHVPNFWYWLP